MSIFYGQSAKDLTNWQILHWLVMRKECETMEKESYKEKTAEYAVQWVDV
jgi:hypothetical protein